jgi:hypothetical protein
MLEADQSSGRGRVRMYMYMVQSLHTESGDSVTFLQISIIIVEDQHPALGGGVSSQLAGKK